MLVSFLYLVLQRDVPFYKKHAKQCVVIIEEWDNVSKQENE